MKKSLVGLLMILSSSIMLAHGYGHGYSGGADCNGGTCNWRGGNNTNPVVQQYRVKLQENRLNLSKEMAKAKPDFKVVERLNKEQAEIIAKIKTENMKANYNQRQQSK